MARRLLLLDVVGLTADGLRDAPFLAGLARDGSACRLDPPLPAVTCASQATLLTGTPPRDHGIVGNGWLYRDLAQVWFWRRSDRLVAGRKLWEDVRAADPSATCANLFWRFCTHASAETVLTERPAYWSDGRKSPDVFARPARLRDELVERLGPFPLFRFWGPAAGIDSTRWIAGATRHVLARERPGLLLSYLPHLDYDLQRHGPGGRAAAAAHRDLDDEARRVVEEARGAGMDVAVVSEYGVQPVSRPVYLNRILREAGYVEVDRALNGEILEPGLSRAFAVCDHQVAHVYVRDASDLAGVRALLARTEGVGEILDSEGKRRAGLDHARAGEIVAVAAPGAWFAYPYWLEDRAAPDFARTVDIHQKPGYDPNEMFLAEGAMARLRLGWRLLQKAVGIRAPFDVIGLDPGRVRGSHGRPPAGDGDAPLLIASWKGGVPERMAMMDVKRLLLDRMLAPAGASA